MDVNAVLIVMGAIGGCSLLIGLGACVMLVWSLSTIASPVDDVQTARVRELLEYFDDDEEADA